MAMVKPVSNAALAIDVSRLHDDHPKVCAKDWRSPLVRRLLGRSKYADGTASLNDSFRDQDLKEVPGEVPLYWKGLKVDFDQRINSYQEHILTEHANLRSMSQRRERRLLDR